MVRKVRLQYELNKGLTPTLTCKGNERCKQVIKTVCVFKV